jgi:hypothetical protein
VVGVTSIAAAPPWRLGGECVVGWVGGVPPSLRSLLPSGVRGLPGGGALLSAVAYASSPVGPYLELSVALPARLGLRPGLCVVFQLVSLPDARLAHRSSWGLPASVADLVWDVDGATRVLRSPSLELVVRGEPHGPSLPVAVPVRSVQRRADGPVVVPRRFVGLARAARLDVSWTESATSGHGADVDALLGSLVGRHRGALLSGLRILARPARHPAGLWSSLRAPLTVPEPAMSVPGAS